MRDARVAPVEHHEPPVAHEHVPVVEVVVLDRLGDAQGRELRARVVDPRHRLPEALPLVRAERERRVVEDDGELRRDPPQSMVGGADA